jgi:hypothetical protein
MLFSLLFLEDKGSRWMREGHKLKLTPNREMLSAEALPAPFKPKSYLPSSSQGAHPPLTALSTTGGSSSSGGPVAEYLPTVEQKECYEVVEVERVVTAPTPQQPPKNPTVTKLENVLYQHLLVFRNDLARDVQIAPFLVCSNGLLADLARARPQTLESMKTVEGVSEVWLQKYGDKFLETIGSFCGTRDVDVPMDAHLSAASTQPQSAPTIVKEKLVKGCQIVGALTDIIMTSYSAFTQEKLSMVLLCTNSSWLIGSKYITVIVHNLHPTYWLR